MESRWYYFPGQTPQNTKIVDRKKALHASSSAWKKITGHLDRERLVKETIEKEQARKKEIKEKSYAMTKNWPDSIANAHRRQDQERVEKKQKLLDDRLKAFYKLREEQQAVQNEFCEKQRRKLFEMSHDPKTLNSALFLSAVMYDRQKQIEFNQFLADHDNADEQKEAERYKKEAEDEIREKREYAINETKKRLEYGAYLREEIAKLSKKEQDEREKCIKSELLDQIKAREEMELIEQMEREEKQQCISEMREEFKKFFSRKKQMQQENDEEERDFNKAVSIYATAKLRIDCLLRQKMKEVQASAEKRAAKMTELIMEKLNMEQGDEDERIQKAYEEKLRLEDKRAADEAEKIAKLRQERINDEIAYKEWRAQQKGIEKEVFKLQLLNRHKADNAEREYEQEKLRQTQLKMSQMKKDRIEEIAESKRLRKLEEKFNLAPDTSYDEADLNFMAYGHELLELAKSRGYSTIPIEKVIEEYKIKYGMKKRPPRVCMHQR